MVEGRRREREDKKRSTEGYVRSEGTDEDVKNEDRLRTERSCFHEARVGL